MPDTFTLTIDLAKDAFDADKLGEIARILRVAADLVENGAHSHNARDVNGNTVAHWEIG
jgi:hypothetical protein